MNGFCAALFASWLLVLVLAVATTKHDTPAPVTRVPYNETLAKRLMFLSAGAYALSPEPCIKRTLPTNQKFHLTFFNNYTCDHLDNKCAYFITLSEVSKEVIVVFRGTKSKKQLLTEGWDSMQPTVDFYGTGRVNKYFFFALNTMWEPIESTLKNPKYANYSVTFTGHSLGGALASLASIRTVLDSLRRSDQITLYTFGQPRIGDHQFALRHGELVPTSYRVVNQLDIVPHLPACAKNEYDLRYADSASKPCDPQATNVAYHHGIEIWYPSGMGPSNRYIECLGEPKNEDMDCSNSVLFELANYGRYIWDHRHYFGHKVVGLGKLGCDPDTHIEETVAVENTGSLGATATSKAGKGSSEAPKKHSGVENVLLNLGQLIGIHRTSGGRAPQS